MKQWLSGTIAGTLVLTIMGGIVSVLWPMPMPAMPPNIAWWATLGYALTAAVLAGIAVRSSWYGWRLALGLFVVLFMVRSFTSMIEAVFFDIFFDRTTAFGFLFRDFVSALAAAPALVACTGRFRASGPAQRAMPWPSHLVARFAASGALYVVLYFIFGIAISPFIRDFYATKHLPGPLAIIAMQLLVRGPIFAAIMLLVARMIRGPARTNALHGALVMSIIGGVAPLIIPNPYFPEMVRWAHFFEVGIENFIFGWVVAWMMTPGLPDRHEMANAA